METLLLILVLVGDPSGNELADGLAADLKRRAGELATVVAGPPALAMLRERDLSPRDLLVTPNIGAHLTGGTPPAPIIVMHIDRSERAGDVLVETHVWTDGRNERHIAIAGAGHDPLPAVLSGVLALMGHRIGQAVAAGPPADGELARLAEGGHWLDLLARLAEVTERSPRQRYYEILAYAKLGQRDPAVQALNRLRLDHPGHFLIAAGEELIPPLPGAVVVPPAEAAPGEENILRD